MRRGSAYRATLVSATLTGRDGRGNNRYRVTWRTALDNDERSANTRGWVDGDLQQVEPGDRVNLIRDGRGSIIVIEKTSEN